jgi:hypothetical protein
MSDYGMCVTVTDRCWYKSSVTLLAVSKSGAFVASCHDLIVPMGRPRPAMSVCPCLSLLLNALVSHARRAAPAARAVCPAAGAGVRDRALPRPRAVSPKLGPPDGALLRLRPLRRLLPALAHPADRADRAAAQLALVRRAPRRVPSEALHAAHRRPPCRRPRHAHHQRPRPRCTRRVAPRDRAHGGGRCPACGCARLPRRGGRSVWRRAEDRGGRGHA